MPSSNITKGALIHAAAAYDLLIWLVTLGREGRLRAKLLRPACLQPGESVLDVGCGTGSLAIAAKRQVGAAGEVCGLDASAPMIVRARNKARKAGLELKFQSGIAEALPFADAQFDVVLNTVMLHHLPRKARQQCVGEMRRVLKLGGRLLVVEFGGAASHGRGPIAHLHRHGQIKPHKLVELVGDAGFNIVATGMVGIWDLQFILAEPQMR